MVTLEQIRAKIVGLTHKKHSFVYEKGLYEQKIEQIKAGIETINGAISVYQDWEKNLVIESEAKKAEKKNTDKQTKKDKKVKESDSQSIN